MPTEYQHYLDCISTYDPPKTHRGKAGGFVFLTFWEPVMGLMEKITNLSLQRDGYAPLAVIWLVRATVYLIWFTHDFFFAPLCGRGDGYTIFDSESKHGTEEDPLLARKEGSVPYIV